jgi:hypothetical protein
LLERPALERSFERSISGDHRNRKLLAAEGGRHRRVTDNLGIALARLGERESGTARLEQAVDAYRDALKERTRERVPLQ